MDLRWIFSLFDVFALYEYTFPEALESWKNVLTFPVRVNYPDPASKFPHLHY